MTVTSTALISGGARGIGRCLTRRFCERGYKVYVWDIDEDELTYTVKTHLASYYESGSLGFGLCNLGDTEDIRKQAGVAAEFLDGKIDVLVNNGAIAAPHWKDGKTMADFETLTQWRAYMDINLTNPFAVSQACIKYLAKAEDEARHENDSDSGPCIINIGSFRAHHSDRNQEGYASSKSGLLGLMHSMAVSLQHWDIRVNTVSPGRILVNHESRAGDEKGMTWAEQNEDSQIAHHLSNRAGRPKDIADAVEYLVNAGFVTGQEIVVDGGTSKKKQ